MNANEKRIFKAFLRFLKENKLMKTYEDNLYDYVKNITIKNIKRLTSIYKNISSDLTVMNSLIIYTISIHFLYKLLWNGKIQ